MFKAGRWKSEKKQIKIVFKLQFRVSQVPQLGWDALMVALVPLEVGKPTVKSEKSVIHEGACRWDNPIYETMRFIKDPKTGNINDKIYQFLVSTGSSKNGFLGEATINFADYAETFKPQSISLPLKTASFGAVLHVTIHRFQAAAGGREVEENGDLMVRSPSRTLRSQLSNYDKDGNDEPSNGISNRNSVEDGSSIIKNMQQNLAQNKTVSQHANYNGILRPSSGSDDISESSLDSSSGQETPQGLGSKSNNNSRQNIASFLSSLSSNAMTHKPMANIIDSVTEITKHRRSNTEWSVSSAPDGSIDDSPHSSENTLLNENSEAHIEKLKNDITVLARQSEVLELELQTLRRQIARESQRGNHLSREVSSLKEERDALRSECEQLKASKQNENGGRALHKLQFESRDQRFMLEDIKQELSYEKDLNANLRLQLQKTQESNSQLILAVQELEELLEQKNNETPNLVHEKCGLHLKVSERNGKAQEMESEREMAEDEEQHELEVLVSDHIDAEVDYSLQQKIIDLSNELEVYKKDREDLEMQMEQLELDYEILKQENHEMSLKMEQNQLQEQMKMQYECASSLAVVSELDIHVESLEKELKKQEEAFEANLEAMMRAKVEQEERACRAEEALRKMRMNNASTAERLQEEINRLSMQMSSTFEANEKLAMQALTEASELRLRKSHLEELLERANEDLGVVKDRYEEKMLELSNQCDFHTKQTEQLLADLEDKSKELENLKKSVEARDASLSQEITMLQTEVERLGKMKTSLSEQIEEKEKLKVEIEKMKTLYEEMKWWLERANNEREELESKLASLMEEAEKQLKEFNEMRLLKDEKEKMIGILQSEVESLRGQYNDLKHSLLEDESEKEKSRKQLFQLKGELQKKEDTINIIEKKLKDNSTRVVVTNGTTKPALRNTKSGPPHHGSKEVSNLREKIKLLEGELKQKQATLQNTTRAFLKKEKDLCNKIEEMEKCIEEIRQNNSPSFHENKFRKEKEDTQNITENFKSQGVRNMAENLGSDMGDQLYFPDQDSDSIEPMRSSSTDFHSKKEFGVLNFGTKDQGNDDAELLNEMALLKQSNKTMETELKDMQERYSEISLKFAEVEGERQQLVMTIRNLKNAIKN